MDAVRASGLVGLGGGEARHLVSADAAGVAELDDGDVGGSEAVQHQVGELGVKALAHYVCAVAQGAIHQCNIHCFCSILALTSFRRGPEVL